MAETRERWALVSGEPLERWCEAAARLVQAARLNKFFPDPFGIADTLRLMAPSAREGVYEGLVLDRTSGMPRLKDVVAVHADRANAAEFLREAQLRDGRSATPRYQAKLAYYRKLAAVELPPLHRLEVKLRRVFADRGVASFEVTLDRFDAAENVWVRYTLLLEQTDSSWAGRLLERSGDYTNQTGAFRALMEKYAHDDSEITFLLLGKMPGIRIEEVVRGRVGPLWSPPCPPSPGWFPRDARGCYVLHCPLDRASVGMEADQDQDPFSVLYKDFLSEDSRPIIEEAAQRLGYRVHKERKFACTQAAAESLNARLSQAKTSNVVYPA
ncbi:MAG: hypothetical protein FD126_923 [Elusimicrobia bacterium]|nr:MAG: hypothetical protein FD126_923 [Elusimicrobiota bacterium]